MIDNDELRNELHARIDAEADARKRQIDEARQKSHEWIDNAPPGMFTLLSDCAQLPSLTQTYQPTSSSQPASNGAQPKEQLRIAIKDDVDRIIAAFASETEVTSLKVYERLLEQRPEVKEADAANIKARIAMALTRLVETDKLVLIRKGGGNIPHVYQKTKLQKIGVTEGIDAEIVNAGQGFN
jgi:hypothetical protein